MLRRARLRIQRNSRYFMMRSRTRPRAGASRPPGRRPRARRGGGGARGRDDCLPRLRLLGHRPGRVPDPLRMCVKWSRLLAVSFGTRFAGEEPRLESPLWRLVGPVLLFWAARRRARPLLWAGGLPVGDRAAVAVLGLQHEVALALILGAGLPDRGLVLLAARARGAGARLELAARGGRACVRVVLSAGQERPAEPAQLAGNRHGRDVAAAPRLDALPERP